MMLQQHMLSSHALLENEIFLELMQLVLLSLECKSPEELDNKFNDASGTFQNSKMILDFKNICINIHNLKATALREGSQAADLLQETKTCLEAEKKKSQDYHVRHLLQKNPQCVVCCLHIMAAESDNVQRELQAQLKENAKLKAKLDSWVRFFLYIIDMCLSCLGVICCCGR